MSFLIRCQFIVKSSFLRTSSSKRVTFNEENSRFSSLFFFDSMNNSLVLQLESIGILINGWIGLIILIFGILGNLFNLILFLSRRTLNPSISLYFVLISMNNLILFLIGLTSRVVIDGFQVKILGDDSTIFCKLRTYFVYTLFSISNWLLVFATVDRFYSTNSSALKRNYVCSISLAKKLIFSTILICFFIHSHILIFYKYFYSINSFDQYELICSVENIVYKFFFAFFILIFFSLSPPILILILGLLTLKNLRQSRRTIHPIHIENLPQSRDRNQLIKILSIQIIMLLIFTIPHSIYWIFIGFHSTVPTELKTNLDREYEQFFLHLVRLLLYINNGSSFYIQMTFSKTFRREFCQFCFHLKRIFAPFCFFSR